MAVYRGEGRLIRCRTTWDDAPLKKRPKWPNWPKNGLRPTWRSNAHQFVQFGCRHRPVEESEAACIFYFACGIEKARHGRAVERCREADAAHSGRRKFLYRE